MNTVTLINPFQVNTDQEQVFFNAWKAVHEYMKQQPGFIETKLHRSLDNDGTNQIYFINIAIWESKEAFLAVVRSTEFQTLSKAVLTFSLGPKLYEVFYEDRKE